jgi:hypothetical protein
MFSNSTKNKYFLKQTLKHEKIYILNERIFSFPQLILFEVNAYLDSQLLLSLQNKIYNTFNNNKKLK